MSRGNRNRRPARRAQQIEPRERILVLCEGKNTEPQYVRGFRRWCQNSLVDVVIAGAHGVPLTLVREAKRLMEDARERAKRERDEFLSYDSVWCVFDVDEHPNVPEAVDMACANGIELAISNPCFELWLLLHFRENPGAQHRHTLQAWMKSLSVITTRRSIFCSMHLDTAMQWRVRCAWFRTRPKRVNPIETPRPVYFDSRN